MKNVFTLMLFVSMTVSGLQAETVAVVMDFHTRQNETPVTTQDSSAVVKRLSSRIPAQRREAAEELARSAASEYRRLLDGYRVQEKDARVRVAMDWALYRLGKNEALFSVVRALDSKQSDQAVEYLNGIEGPEPLYLFLNRVNGNTLIRLLEVLAQTGNTSTLEQIRPFTASLDPGIADAAKFAEREITLRVEETPVVEPKRPRRTGAVTIAEP